MPKIKFNPFAILGISDNASDEEIKKAYRKLIFEWHPDRNLNNIKVATEMSEEITAAHEFLKDPLNKLFLHGKYDELVEKILSQFPDEPKKHLINYLLSPLTEIIDTDENAVKSFIEVIKKIRTSSFEVSCYLYRKTIEFCAIKQKTIPPELESLQKELINFCLEKTNVNNLAPFNILLTEISKLPFPFYLKPLNSFFTKFSLRDNKKSFYEKILTEDRLTNILLKNSPVTTDEMKNSIVSTLLNKNTFGKRLHIIKETLINFLKNKKTDLVYNFFENIGLKEERSDPAQALYVHLSHQKNNKAFCLLLIAMFYQMERFSRKHQHKNLICDSINKVKKALSEIELSKEEKELWDAIILNIENADKPQTQQTLFNPSSQSDKEFWDTVRLDIENAFKPKTQQTLFNPSSQKDDETPPRKKQKTEENIPKL